MKTLASFLLALAPVLAQQPRIGVGGVSHESNSFFTQKTTLADFGSLDPVSPEEFIRRRAPENTTVAGYIEGAKRFGLSLYPTLVVGAQPKGPVTAEAFEKLTSELVRRLKTAPKLDGILLALHGAMVTEDERFPSGDAEIVRRVREAMGPAIPIVVTHDFHANVTQDIIRHSTALITYKENPHIDTKERGVQAAQVIHGAVTGKTRPVQVMVRPPMVYNIVHQYTRREPLLPIVEESRRLEKNPRILAVSVSGGYQYADVPEMGPSVTVVTDNDRALAEREAKRLSDMLWATRDRLALNLPDPAEAVRQAKAAGKFPIAFMDMGDNIGGGTPGDSTFILEELIRQKAEGWVVVIADREANETAFRVGVDGTFDMAVGGKTDDMHGKPVRVRGRVKSLHHSRFIEPEVRHGGGRYHDNGLVSVIEAEGSNRDVQNYLVLTTRRTSPNTLRQLTSLGIYPQEQKILVAKGTIAPMAAYVPVAARIIQVDSPGATAVNPARFTFRRVPKGLFGMPR